MWQCGGDLRLVTCHFLEFIADVFLSVRPVGSTGLVQISIGSLLDVVHSRSALNAHGNPVLFYE